MLRMDEYPKTAVFCRSRRSTRTSSRTSPGVGEGMSNFIKREVVTRRTGTSIATTSPSGGHRPLDLWAKFATEDKRHEMEDLSNSMGLFLQKTNIIRDYLEDIEEPAPRSSAPSACGASTARPWMPLHPENRYPR